MAKKVKNPENVRIGKRNKRAGYLAERDLEKLLVNHGINAKRVAMSGALSGKNLIGSGTNTFQGDLHIYTTDGDPLIIECKKRANISGLYNLYEKHGSFHMYDREDDNDLHILDIEGLLNNLDNTNGLLLNSDFETVIKKIPKYLKEWFIQDDADIVAVKMNHKPFLFIIKEIDKK